MPLYEIMCVTTMQASTSQLVNTFRKVGSEVFVRGGVIRGIENLGVRPLAYRMKAHQRWNELGRYVRVRTQMGPHALQAVQRRLREDPAIIRSMPIKLERLAPKKPVKKARAAKPSWLPDEATVDAVARIHPELDYYVARQLLRQGKLDRAAVEAMPKHKE